ncbi:hypothetical protein C8Q74DRAFT_1219491 [Fomes fomentarius]|nr:hypothetical protein C8Q74DRAFT_1219491 [Fomes fomentarius]
MDPHLFLLVFLFSLSASTELSFGRKPYISMCCCVVYSFYPQQHFGILNSPAKMVSLNTLGSITSYGPSTCRCRGLQNRGNQPLDNWTPKPSREGSSTSVGIHAELKPLDAARSEGVYSDELAILAELRRRSQRLQSAFRRLCQDSFRSAPPHTAVNIPAHFQARA